MEDLTIIRIKRTLESTPLENINLTSKKFKLDSGNSLPVIATLKSKDESLEAILQTAVTKFKQEKQANKQKLYARSHHLMYKLKKTPLKSSKTAAFDRYQIVNKACGITPLDAEAESYLLKTDKLSLNLPDGAKNVDGAGPSQAGDTEMHTAADTSIAVEGNGARMIALQFLDVDHCSVKELNKIQEDLICMNGVPLEQSYVYDIFITRVPKGYSTEEFLISENDQLVDDTPPDDEDLGSNSDDSNDENNYRNDYPDAEESDMNESEGDGSEFILSDGVGFPGTSQYWGDNVADQMAHCSLGDDEDSDECDGEGEGNRDFLSGEPIPLQYRSLFRLSKAVLSKMKQNDCDSDSEDSRSEGSDSDA